MIQLRRFYNNDSPAVAAIWNDQPPLRGRLKSMTPAVLEQHVFGKPYFDPLGFLVAFDGERCVGFIHVGFAPTLTPGQLDSKRGLICQLMVLPSADSQAVSSQLLQAGENWLLEQGAVELFGGSCGIQAPFYVGLYGGCRSPGVLADDATWNDALRAAGYHEHRVVTIWERNLTDFRTPVDRTLMALRRQYPVQQQPAERSVAWCDACAFGWIDRREFSMSSSSPGAPTCSLTFWDMEPLAGSWGLRVAGLADAGGQDMALNVDLQTYLLADSLRQLQAEGVSLVEVQTDSSSELLVPSCEKLVFRRVDRGVQFRKPAIVD